MIAAPHPLGAKLLLPGVMALASLPAFFAYPGDHAALLAFDVAAIAMVAAASFGRPGFFCIFTAAFLGLGFWVKLNAHWSLDLAFNEPVGDFPQTAEAWDRALLAATAGLAGVALAMAAVKLLDRRPRTVDLALAPASASANALLALFAVSAVGALALFVVNFHFAILKIGTVPRIDLHPTLYAMASFTVSWGAVLWLGALAFWLVGSGRAPVDFPLYVAATEGAAAALSMGSRAQMILHVAACVAAWAACRRALGWRLSRLRCLAAAAFVCVLFAFSLVGVSLDRISNFYGPPPPATVATSVAPRGSSGGGVAERRPAAERGAISAAAVERMAGEVAQLFIGRWIGMEGVLAVSGEPGRGLGMLWRGMSENPARGVDAMYQRLAKSIYQRSEAYVFLTVPGPVAVLLYGGSLALVALGMGAMVVACHALERLCDASTRNPGASAVVGTALAYLFVQMMFPRTLLFFAIELLPAIALLGCFRLACRMPRQDARRAGSP